MAKDSPLQRNRVWNMTLGGFISGLQEANKLKRDGWPAKAAVRFASLFYSYRVAPFFGIFAREQAFKAAYLGREDDKLWTDGECDIIGTVMLRGGYYQEAKKFLTLGLTKKPPPHSEALLHIGLAEIAQNWALSTSGPIQRQYDAEMSEHLTTALALRNAVEEEADRVQALRQFGRVLLRAALLMLQRGMTDTATGYYEAARAIARDPVTGSRGARIKIWLGWNFL